MSEGLIKPFQISSIIELYSFSILFKTNSSWLITESIKAWEIKTSMLCNLDFANKTILSCFIDLQFLIPEVIAKNLNPTAKLVLHIGIPTKEVKEAMEKHPEL